MKSRLAFAFLPLALVALGGCETPLPTAAQFSESARGTQPPGYLEVSERRLAATTVPAPPPAGSAAQAADDEAFRNHLRINGSARWRWAIHDRDVRFPGAADRFTCAVGIPIGSESTPNLYMLLRRSFVDAALAAYEAKAPFPRKRPFVANNDPICTPEAAEAFRRDTSYPAAAAAVGWTWTLLLVELAPDRTDAIVRRGQAYGESSALCGVHWQSDVEAGRHVGSVVAAQLHANRDFQRQFAGAREEIARQRASGARSGVDCDAERSALGG